MSDELKLRKDAERAARATRLIDDPLLTEIFTGLEAEYVDFWRGKTAIADVDGRERLWQAVQIIGKVRNQLKTIAADGRMAERELQKLAQGG